MFAKVDKILGKIKENTVIMLDSYNMLANGSDSSTNELDLVEAFNEFLSFPQRNETISLVFGVNRDLFREEEAIWYREYKHSN